jgi:RHS repeat-associated protein
MGNITALKRYQAGTLIDSLIYGYTVGGNNTNILQSVIDNSGSNAGLANGTTGYLYDGNGNMLSASNSINTAGNKSFTYNILNLPATATFATGSATFAYDAAGNKLRKASTAGSTTTYTDYINGIQYSGTTSESIAFIQTEEGKAVPNGTTNYDYTYYLGDNLGNTRVTFDTKNGYAQSQQVDDYYPFGLEINRTPYTPKNEYLYNKKELQEEFGEYDYGARFYDPVIGRWTSVDPLAEVSMSWSPYKYGLDNPIRFIDLYGLSEDEQEDYFSKHRVGGKHDYIAVDYGEEGGGGPPPDWVMDNKTHEARYDPNVHKASDVKKGETYIGKTGSYIAVGGAEIHLKADGSWVPASMDNGTDPRNVLRDLGIGKGWDTFADILEFTTGLLGGGFGGLEEVGATLLEDSGSETVSGGTSVFRAVDAAEAKSISSTGQFLINEGGTQGKYFAQSLEDAHWYGSKLYPEGYSIVRGSVQEPIGEFWHPNVDIGAYFFPTDFLLNVTPIP